MMPEHKLSSRIFGVISTLTTRHPWWVVGVYAVLSAVSMALSWAKLEMKTDQNDLVSAQLPYNQRYLHFLREFGDLEFLYVVIIVDGQPARAMQVADAVAAEVGQLHEEVVGVLHRIPPESFGDGAILLAQKQDLESLSKAVVSNRDLIERVQKVDRFSRLLEELAGGFEPARAQSSPEVAALGLKVIDTSLEALLACARGEKPPSLEQRIREGDPAAPDPLRQGYLFSSNQKLAFVEILPKKDFTTLAVIDEPLDKIRGALDRVRQRFPDMKLGLTGRPVLQADEMRTTNDDMIKSTVLAFFGVLALFVAFFKRLRRPLLASVALSVAIALTFGLVTITLGYLTLLSIVFAAMLVGLGVDFGVVLVARYQEELLERDDIDEAMRATLQSTGMGVWTGALTTGCAFFASMFVDFKGLAELGFVSGAGLIICLICMLTLLPALVVITDHRIRKRRRLKPPHPVTIPLLGYMARRPRTTLIIFGCLTAAGFYHFHWLPYNSNLLELQAKGLESVDYELAIIEKSDRSTWYSAFITDSLENVDHIVEGLKARQETGVIGFVESARDYLPADQDEKIEVLKPAADSIATLHLPEPSASADPVELGAALEKLLDSLDKAQSLAASRGGADGAAGVKAVEGLIRRVEEVQALLEKDAAATASRIAAGQGPWFTDLAGLVAKLQRMLRPPRLVPESLPEEVRRRFVSKDGHRFLAYAYPKKDVWEEKNMEGFVKACAEVDRDFTGVPLQVYESSRRMRDGFVLASLYSLIMVFCFLVLDFRNLKDVLVTMVPVVVGVLWALQLMPYLGLQFNLANFFALPIMIGSGVDAGVHMVHRFRETGSTEDVGKTTGTAVTLANLSNMIGFASMGIARHRGIVSLGLVTALGCFTVLVASVVLLPCFLEVLKDKLVGRKAAEVKELVRS